MSTKTSTGPRYAIVYRLSGERRHRVHRFNIREHAIAVHAQLVEAGHEARFRLRG